MKTLISEHSSGADCQNLKKGCCIQPGQMCYKKPDTSEVRETCGYVVYAVVLPFPVVPAFFTILKPLVIMRIDFKHWLHPSLQLLSKLSADVCGWQ